MSTITSSDAAVETHTLAFDDGPTFEVTIDDNGDITISLYSEANHVVMDTDAWDSVVDFVKEARSA